MKNAVVVWATCLTVGIMLGYAFHLILKMKGF